MTQLKLATHTANLLTSVCEVWQNGKMIATIYPSDEGIRVISKFHLDASYDGDTPNAVKVFIDVE